MNKELHLFSIVRKKKPNYEKSTPHKVFENKLNQNFTAKEKIQNGVRTTPIYLLQMVVSVITVPLLICVIEVSLPVLRINISIVH